MVNLNIESQKNWEELDSKKQFEVSKSITDITDRNLGYVKTILKTNKEIDTREYLKSLNSEEEKEIAKKYFWEQYFFSLEQVKDEIRAYKEINFLWKNIKYSKEYNLSMEYLSRWFSHAESIEQARSMVKIAEEEEAMRELAWDILKDWKKPIEVLELVYRQEYESIKSQAYRNHVDELIKKWMSFIESIERTREWYKEVERISSMPIKDVKPAHKWPTNEEIAKIKAQIDEENKML